MKRIWKWLLFFLGFLMLLVLGVIIAFQVSVKPGVYIIGKMFEQPVEIIDEAHYEEVAPLVDVIHDVTYDSSYRNNKLDVYYPKTYEAALPVLFWVHGGGYVSGDKEGVEEFATYIAAHNQIAVVALNYETAPNLQYPGQVKQLDEAYNFIQSQEEFDLALDLSKVLFGGDSAGAQIAGQYVAVQTNQSYAEAVGVDQHIPLGAIQSFISYSGPVDLEQMAKARSDDRFMRFFVDTVARALIGKRNWQESEEIHQASIPTYVTKDFPPTYITDGNAYSFQEQGQALEERLRSLDIPVKSLFFTNIDKEITHEYQFNYELPEAKQSLEETIAFIQEHIK